MNNNQIEKDYEKMLNGNMPEDFGTDDELINEILFAEKAAKVAKAGITVESQLSDRIPSGYHTERMPMTGLDSKNIKPSPISYRDYAGVVMHDSTKKTMEKLSKLQEKIITDAMIPSEFLGTSSTVDKINEDELNEVIDILKDTRTEENEKIMNLPSNNILKPVSQEYLDSIEESKELYKDGEVLTADVNTITGEIKYLHNENEDYSDNTLSEVLSEDSDTKYNIGGESDIRSLVETGLSEDDASQLVGLLSEYENNRELKDIYGKLPESIQKSIQAGIPLEYRNNKKSREMMAKSMIEYFRSELVLDKEFVDLQTSLSKELDVPDLMESYMEHIKGVMEVELIKKADLVDSENHELAERLRKMSSVYTDTYTFQTLRNKIKNKGNISKQLNSELKDYDKITKKFCSKYAHSKFAINDIRLIPATLSRRIDEKYSWDEIAKFVILICNVSKSYDTSEPFEHAWMYYTVKNIISLDGASSTKTEFSEEIVKNIEEVLELLRK